MKYTLLALFFAALSGCANVAPPRPGTDTAPSISGAPIGAGDACKASAYKYLTGQPAETLEKVYILDQVRILRPGKPVTKDLRAERLNFSIDAMGRITRVFCG